MPIVTGSLYSNGWVDVKIDGDPIGMAVRATKWDRDGYPTEFACRSAGKLYVALDPHVIGESLTALYFRKKYNLQA